MINDGCGLCVKLLGDKNKALFVRCERTVHDVNVKDCLAPYVVAVDIGEHSWGSGSYFVTLEDALKYYNKT